MTRYTSLMSVRTRSVKDPFSGLSHLAGAALAIFGAAWLVSRAGPRIGVVASACVYGVCLVGLFAASATYHLVLTNERATRVLRMIDHSAIFAMVAGTCTPIFYRAFSGSAAIVLII